MSGPHRPDEPPLDPDIEIVDAHTHFWSEPQPAYLLDDLAKDAARSGHNVVQNVFIEVGWGIDPASRDPMAPVAEMPRVLNAVRDASNLGPPRVAGIVAHADLRHGAAVGDVLDALGAAAGGMLSGIRHTTAWDADPAVPVHRHRPGPRLMSDPAFRAGFAELARRSIPFDAWVYHPQLDEVAEVADAFPDVPIVIDHLGGPLRVGSYAARRAGSFDDCLESLARVATRPNVHLKLGGIGMTNIGREFEADAPPTSEQLAARWSGLVLRCIEMFGSERCMFESNFPVDRETCSYGTLWNTFQRIVAGGSSTERRALMAGTARRFYGLPPADDTVKRPAK